MFIRRRIRRRRAPLPFRYVFIISLLLFLLFTWQGLMVIEKGIRPTLMLIAENETERIASYAINDALTKRIVEEEEMQRLVLLDKTADGKITSVGFDPVIANKVLAKATLRAKNYLKKVETGRLDELSSLEGIDVEKNGTPGPKGVVHMIPLGQATNNAFLANFGPKIPVQFTVIGDVQSDLKQKIHQVGINNTSIELLVHIEVKVKVIIPFATKTSTVKSDIVVANRYIQGDVPQYFNSSKDNQFPKPSIPQNKEKK